jgi:hypothetical protein
MANELKNALDQIKTDVAAITGVQRAMLGQPLDALPDATQTKCVAAIYMTSGAPLNDTYTATEEQHIFEMRFYWLLQKLNVEVVEQSMASMWDLILEKFFDSDADRNLSEKVTCALVGGDGGRYRYRAGYEEIGGKWHRVLIVPLEIVINTHSV